MPNKGDYGSLRNQIISVMGHLGRPLDRHDLLQHCDAAEDLNQVSRALHKMRVAGIIECTDAPNPPTAKGARAAAGFQLIQQRADNDDNDEYARLAAAIEATMDTAKLEKDDPVLTAINSMPVMVPAIDGGERHATRLLGLALRAEHPQEITDWLAELADIIRSRSA